MSQLFVDNIKNKLGGPIEAPSGLVVTGVVTATSFSGDGSGLSGIDATALKDSGGSVKLQGNTSGIVVTGVSTFTGNVSISGTLTYDDVTNVDSVGLITARSGIRIGAGQSVSAVSGIATYYGDGSQLSGVESGVSNFVASGTIANGATVVVNTDGTVGIVTLTTVGAVGTPVVFESASTEEISSVYDSTNQKVVVVYRDEGNSSYTTAVVGTVNGSNNSITFGTPVVAFSSANLFTSASFDSSNGKVVIAVRDASNSNYGTAIVGTVSGTSISFGTKVAFENGQTNHIVSSYVGSGKVVFAYQDGPNSDRGTAVVGTVSGTSISFGTLSVFETGGVADNAVTYDSDNGKVVIAYKDKGNSNYGTAVVGTVSGTDITFGTPVVFNSANSINSQFTAVTFDSNSDKVVIAYRDAGNSNYGTAIVGTVSGTSITFGSEVVFNSANTQDISAVYDATNQKVVISYQDNGNSNYGTVITGTVSGTSISFGNPVVFESASTEEISSVYDPTNQKVVISYQDNGNSSYGTSSVIRTYTSDTNLTSENYIGIAAEAISDTATGKITVVGGINTGQTGLTTAQKYFVQPNGTLATSAGTPSVVAGTAISDTKIVVR